MKTTLKLIISENHKTEEFKTEIIENVSVINMNGRLVFTHEGETDICVYADTDIVDLETFSQEHQTMEVIIKFNE